MATVEDCVRPLSAGDKLDREEFLRLWDAHSEIKRAELIGGVVYMPSPLSIDHGDSELDVGYWIAHYKSHTKGTAAGTNTTSYILDDSPQPDINLRILPEHGGRSRVEKRGNKRYLAGVPELLVEICLSSAAYDLHQKLDLYQTAGIPEYLAVLVHEREIRWHMLENGVYQLLPADADGIHRSRVFPGLWLDGAALLVGDTARVLAKLDEGLRSVEHAAFVEKLARNRKA
jgi:Uma2 family endonuclease